MKIYVYVRTHEQNKIFIFSLYYLIQFQKDLNFGINGRVF